MPSRPREAAPRGGSIVGGVVGGVAGLEAGLVVGYGAALALDRFYFSGRDPMTNLAMGLLAFAVLVLGGAVLGCAAGATVGVRVAKRWPPRAWASLSPAGRVAAAAVAVLLVLIGPAAYVVAMQREASSPCDPGNERLETLLREPIVTPPDDWRSLGGEIRADEENGSCSGPKFDLHVAADNVTRDEVARYYAQLLERSGWARAPSASDVTVYRKSFGTWEATTTLKYCSGATTPGVCWIEVAAPPTVASD